MNTRVATAVEQKIQTMTQLTALKTGVLLLAPLLNFFVFLAELLDKAADKAT